MAVVMRQLSGLGSLRRLLCTASLPSGPLTNFDNKLAYVHPDKRSKKLAALSRRTRKRSAKLSSPTDHAPLMQLLQSLSRSRHVDKAVAVATGSQLVAAVSKASPAQQASPQRRLYERFERYEQLLRRPITLTATLQVGADELKVDGERAAPVGESESRPFWCDGNGLGLNWADSAAPQTRSQSVFDQLDRAALADKFPRHLNFFDELITWTADAKLPPFPIDNEYGVCDPDKDVPFHEHVFLEKHLTGFPKDGPVRVFMEQVCLGLGQNAFLSVAEKKAYIDEYRKYFELNKALLGEAWSVK